MTVGKTIYFRKNNILFNKDFFFSKEVLYNHTFD